MSFFAAVRWFFKVLREGEPQAALPPPAADAPPPPPPSVSPEPAIVLLGLLQKEGRLVDFLHEDISGYSDAEVGAAVRDIHRGCAKVLRDRLRLEPAVSDAEGASITVPAGYDASRIAVVGNVTGAAPYRATVRHRGWRATEINLPTIAPGADPRVIAPAEVEV